MGTAEFHHRTFSSQEYNQQIAQELLEVKAKLQFSQQELEQTKKDTAEYKKITTAEMAKLNQALLSSAATERAAADMLKSFLDSKGLPRVSKALPVAPCQQSVQ